MSRSGYSDDAENVAMWRGQVANATRGRRGQKLLRDMVAALDAMPDKRLFQGHLVAPDGGVCALGALGQMRGVDMSKFEKYIDDDGECDDPNALADHLGRELDAAYQLIMEVQYMNDEYFDFYYTPGDYRSSKCIEYTPEERWTKMREWAAKQIIDWDVPS